MKSLSLILSLFLVTPTLEAQEWAGSPHTLEQLEAAPVSLIPHPVSVSWENGQSFDLPASPTIACHVSAQSASMDLQKALKAFAVSAKPSVNSDADFTITIDPKSVTQPEGYQLKVTSSSCSIIGHDAAGAFYAVQTLRQMLHNQNGKLSLPACEVTDYPAFKIRSFMHDTGRNFQTVESLKEQLDRFAQYKLNHFHWHLTDNPAWRIECKSYPQLNDPQFRRPGRDPEATYSYDQICDVIAYAKERHITIIPELDMPGHSEYFTKAFGFKMGTPESLPILEKLIDEWCLEIPAEDCPHLHLGADEVHIKDPKGFIKRMTDRVRSHKRIPILWKPGLTPADTSTILQPWGDNAYKGDMKAIPNPILDSGAGYLNSGDAQWLPQKYFFWQACGVAAGSERNIGGELCMWPDVRVDDKKNIFRHSPVWPTLLAFSESLWLGRKQEAKQFMNTTPLRGTSAWNYLHEFENRMADHRSRFFANSPFPWVKQTAIQWQVVGPFPHAKDTPWDQSFAPETQPEAEKYETSGKTLNWKPLGGTTPGLPYWHCPVSSTMYMKTYFKVDSDRTVHLRIGFDTPARSQRRSSGIPPQGKWDSNGGMVWINGKEITPPKWNAPNTQRYTYKTWHKPPQEIPFTDEEFYWTTDPVSAELKKGKNLILIRVPYTHKFQSLKATCTPVKRHGSHWVIDESVDISDTP
ncbi:Glycosyl hydrolase family 20, domain 2 [Rubritalea squalenifaciens DSM 18772]|uniref:beta-N-acetylhexosaminidase n=1 Tax=Rubritalea squalenifaciens DSM 18772 TaxID=1123071 RepID=A0A1M6NSY2_9BACT|nr:beta-N-acetylhexosaminidase [Rubritalea squalenifaciens]SHJ98735.1 Glycosyl hydrolase family 20, domain 2 [Rubritalea squalenifaciens DSM 18772]